MGLFDRFKKAAPAASKVAPAAVAAQWEPGVVRAPVSGEVVALADVPDPVFASEGLGKGCGIKPTEEVVYAPVTGTVSALIESSKHAVGISEDDGVEALVHVGLETVSMGGKGFSYLVGEGQRVNAGDPVLTFSRAAIRDAGHDDTVMMVVSNSDELASVDLCVAGTVAAGEPIIRASK